MIKRIAFWIGIIIVVGSHISMLVMGMPAAQVIPHAVINIVAAGLMIFGSMSLDK
ncbi:MAG: hypothetical protein NTX72_00265 [Candidatus Uhrbacteria bacterium]|nr:hypothetical protein [Candidatus Uhrbacteria bacterium]